MRCFLILQLLILPFYESVNTFRIAYFQIFNTKVLSLEVAAKYTINQKDFMCSCFQYERMYLVLILHRIQERMCSIHLMYKYAIFECFVQKITHM